MKRPLLALSFCCFWKLGNLPLANLVLSNAFFAYSWRTSVLRNILRDRGEDKAYVTHADRFAVLNLILGGLFVLLALLLFALPAASVPAGNS